MRWEVSNLSYGEGIPKYNTEELKSSDSKI